jgi:hypothetical protein
VLLELVLLLLLYAINLVSLPPPLLDVAAVLLVAFSFFLSLSSIVLNTLLTVSPAALALLRSSPSSATEHAHPTHIH